MRNHQYVHNEGRLNTIVFYLSIIILVVCFLYIFLTDAYGQASQAFLQQSFTTTGNSTSVNLTRSGVAYHTLTWYVLGTGTLSACTVKVDSSPDGSTWTSGGVLTHDCTANGQVPNVGNTVNYIRLSLTAYTCSGACTVQTVYNGYVVNQAGGGGIMWPSNVNGSIPEGDGTNLIRSGCTIDGSGDMACNSLIGPTVATVQQWTVNSNGSGFFGPNSAFRWDTLGNVYSNGLMNPHGGFQTVGAVAILDPTGSKTYNLTTVTAVPSGSCSTAGGTQFANITGNVNAGPFMCTCDSSGTCGFFHIPYKTLNLTGPSGTAPGSAIIMKQDATHCAALTITNCAVSCTLTVTATTCPVVP